MAENKQNIIIKIIAILFLVIVFIFGAGTGYKYLLDVYHSKALAKKSLLGKVYGVYQMAQTDFVDDFYRRLDFIAVYGAVQKALGSQQVGDVVVDQYGIFHTVTAYEKVSDKNLQKYAEAMEVLNAKCEENGAKFLYVSLPSKLKPDTKFYLSSIPAYDNTLKMNEYVSEYGIDILKLDDSNLTQDYLRTDGYHYITDHHINTEMAFATAGLIADALNDRYGFNVDSDNKYLNWENYNKKVYEDRYLGSYGRQAGYTYTGMDDYVVMTPKFDTQMTVTTYNTDFSKESTKKGTFEEALIRKERLALEDGEPFAPAAYATYGEYGLVKIVNEKLAGKAPDILIVGTSQMLQLSVLSSNAYGSVTYVTLNLQEGKNIDVHKLIDNNDYDAVIYVSTNRALNSPSVKNSFDLDDDGEFDSMEANEKAEEQADIPQMDEEKKLLNDYFPRACCEGKDGAV